MPPPRFASLRHRDYRLYWIGQIVSISGQQMLWMLEPWLIYEISGSKIYLGVNALAQAIPATALVLLGGVIADRFDQRKLLITMQGALMALQGTVAVLALTEQLEVWHLFVIAFLQASIGSFENPARQSLFPHLVPREAMPNAVALNAAIHPGTRIGSPVIGGFILALVLGATGSARIAAGVVELIGIAGIGVFAAMLALIQVEPVKRSQGRNVVGDMTEGARFIWQNRVLALLIGLAYYNMYFGVAFSVLFPVIAKDVLNVGPDVLGVMWGAMGAGSLMGVVLVSNLSSPVHQRLILVGGPLMLGAGMVGFAITPIYWLSLALLFMLGAGASALNVSIQQNLQMLVTNEFRGRVMGVWSIVHSSIRPLGEMQFSGIAALVSAPVSVIFGGVMMIAGAVFLGVYGHPTRWLVELREAARTEALERTH